MKNKVVRIWAYVLGIVPLIVLACLYTRLPEQVPMHWGLDGTVSYESKNQLWIVFTLGIIMAILFDVLPKIDPKKKNYQKFGKYYDLFAIAMILFMDCIGAIVIVESLWPKTIQVGRLVVILIGILFILMGNLMPKVKTNYYMGIKTPWTLSNPDVWNKTHRLAGKMMFLFGFLNVLAGFLISESGAFIVVIGGAICMTGVPLIMSYIWYRKLEED